MEESETAATRESHKPCAQNPGYMKVSTGQSQPEIVADIRLSNS